MKYRLVTVAFTAALFWSAAPATYGDTTGEPNETFQKALDAILVDSNTPRLAQVLKDVEGEKEEDEDEEGITYYPIPTPTPRKQTVKADPPTLPEWTPTVPQFKPDGPVAKKKIEGEEKIAQTGTSPLTPEQLGNSWETEKTAPFMRTRNNLTVNGKITVRVILRDYYEPKEEVHLEAVRGPKDKVTYVTIYSPIPKAAGDSGK